MLIDLIPLAVKAQLAAQRCLAAVARAAAMIADAARAPMGGGYPGAPQENARGRLFGGQLRARWVAAKFFKA
jgi:hypothetical protein